MIPKSFGLGVLECLWHVYSDVFQSLQKGTSSILVLQSLWHVYSDVFQSLQKGLQASRYHLCGNRNMLKVLGVSLEPTSTEQWG